MLVLVGLLIVALGQRLGRHPATAVAVAATLASLACLATAALAVTGRGRGSATACRRLRRQLTCTRIIAAGRLHRATAAVVLQVRGLRFPLLEAAALMAVVLVQALGHLASSVQSGGRSPTR